MSYPSPRGLSRRNNRENKTIAQKSLLRKDFLAMELSQKLSWNWNILSVHLWSFVQRLHGGC